MSRYDYYGYFHPSEPIKTDEGIKARSKKGKFVKNWWAKRWIDTLEKLIDAGRLRRGKRYARQGQILSIEETKSGIKAKVQGSRSTPYQVSLDITPLTKAQWDAVIDALADQAIFTAQLLSGEMPQDIEDVFTQVGVSLFPGTSAELTTKCSCPDWANPCKHVAAVHYILGERFDEDPFMLFRLRGRTQEQILDALRSRHTDTDEDEASVEEMVIPLSETLDDFWGPSQPPRFKTAIKPPQTELPILKRLGQPTFLDRDLLDTLGPVYEAVTETALKTAFGDQPTSTEDDSSSS
ncbi:MAG: SWIM zinc finger family protein [Anaerolineae bacterium]|nr:SWIM zinc finger family protein [Anaerolineae bacterium]